MMASFTLGLLGQSAEALRARVSGPALSKLSEKLVAHCDSLLDPKSPQYLDYRELKKPTWRERKGIFVVPPAMQNLSAAHLITQNPRYAEAARDSLLAIVRHGLADSASVAWGVQTTGWRHGEGHDKFLFALGVWQVLEFCRETFAVCDLPEMAQFLKDSLRISLESRQGDAANVTNNRGIRGLLASALWARLLDSFEPAEDRNAILDRAWIALEKHLYFAFDAHGAPYEGPAYAGNTLGSLALMAEVLRQSGKPNLLVHRTFERHPNHLAYEWIPGFAGVNNLNDSAHPCGSVSGSLYWMGRTGGELIPWLGHQLDLSPDRLSRPNLMQNSGIRDYLNFLLWWSDTAPVRSPRDLGLPPSRCFPIRGVASHRTGWMDSDLLLSHFCGRQEVLCHRQGDQNHIALYASGDHLLVDAGYGREKDMSQPMKRWFGLTQAHNCVLIDGQAQRGVIESPGWGEGEMVEFSQSVGHSASTGDASSATGPDHRIRQSIRHVALHRDTPFPVITILDRNERDGLPFVTEILWHTHPDNHWITTSQGGVIKGQQKDCHLFAFNLHGGPFDIFAEDGFGRPRLRIRSESKLSEFATILLPLPKGSSSPSARLKGDQIHISTADSDFAIPLYLKYASNPLSGGRVTAN